MIYYDGEEWKVNKYKVTYQVTDYTDFIDNYGDALIQELNLTEDQEERLESIKFMELPIEQATAFVMDDVPLPISKLPIDELIDKIPIDNIDEDVFSLVEEWMGEKTYLPGKYLVHEGVLYLVTRPIFSFDHFPPKVVPGHYKVIKRGMPEFPSDSLDDWSQPNGGDGRYTKGSKVKHLGKIWIPTYEGLNVWTPGSFHHWVEVEQEGIYGT